MTFQDLIITPIWFLLLLFGAFMIRPFVTNKETKPYFIPGLLVKFVGAIALGLIYQFYYGGGDTFTYHTHGSRWIWQAFADDPVVGLELLFQKAGKLNGNTYRYTSHIWQFRDPASFFIIKITAIFDLFTFGTYSATALLFACFSFSGAWAMYSIFYKMYPNVRSKLAFACLFIPSVVFWGSGILKDTITFGALCWVTFALFNIFIWKKNLVTHGFILAFFCWVIFSIKIYILLCLLVASVFFLFRQYMQYIQNNLIKYLSAPILLLFFTALGYYSVNEISKNDSRYALDKIGQTAMVTAYDIRYGWGARHGENSGYTLGELDGSLSSLVSLAPQAIVVTLFRPWLWEVKNSLMLISAIESLIFLIITVYTAVKIKPKLVWHRLNQPTIIFCLIFSLFFAFAVGVSTYNFGTLMRYKIPVMPFYMIMILSVSWRNKII